MLHFELSAVVLVAAPAACCSMYLKFRPTAAATADVCLPMSSVGVHARRTYTAAVLTPYVRVPSYLNV